MSVDDISAADVEMVEMINRRHAATLGRDVIVIDEAKKLVEAPRLYRNRKERRAANSARKAVRE